ncbi:MAG: hypothetical protein IPH93_13935 [Saprospiraceae bacterium]|nr:hypothetical protein [Saprospiraceae bacterium]MBK7810957.1 hypothetical protein [Saprospiraceae bacterium]MBK9630561.1 hypothetical protein [Saprospiraceae bacterium]
MINQALLFAFPVFDITIARYLAARGVDYLGIDLDQLDQLQADRLIAQLREWTSGPLLVGISSDYEKVEIFRSYQSLDEVLFWDKNSTISIPDLKTPQAVKISARISPSLPTDLDQAAKTILNIQNLQNFKLTQSCLGYLFNPGRETQTGIFDFDELEAFLDGLEN